MSRPVGAWRLLLVLALVVSLLLGPVSPAQAAALAAASAAEAAADRPADLPRLFEQALSTSRAGNFGEALPLWDRVVELAPADAAAWSNRGNVRLALGDPLAAIADQTRSIALDPLSPDPHLNRGTAEEALTRWDAAEADYRWILERPSADQDSDTEVRASALYNLGNVQGSRGDWLAARDSFAAAVLTRPGFALARSSEALARFQLGELDEAEWQLRALIRRHPLFADARAALTALLWQRGARGEAESHWVSASGLDPRYRNPEWLLNIRRWPPAAVAALNQFLALA
jgi:tetratricopeptide (TPR) repeat protein